MTRSGGHFFITGFMATGKTTVARLLAVRLDRGFIDADHEIERRAGASIAELFRRYGEQDFRSRERQMLEEIAGAPASIVATGGGIVLAPANRALMRRTGRIVCLTALREAILSCVGDAADRPLLSGATGRGARIDALLDERAAAYADADVTIDTSDRSPEAVVNAIISWLDGATGHVRRES